MGGVSPDTLRPRRTSVSSSFLSPHHPHRAPYFGTSIGLRVKGRYNSDLSHVSYPSVTDTKSIPHCAGLTFHPNLPCSRCEDPLLVVGAPRSPSPKSRPYFPCLPPTTPPHDRRRIPCKRAGLRTDESVLYLDGPLTYRLREGRVSVRNVLVGGHYTEKNGRHCNRPVSSPFDEK